MMCRWYSWMLVGGLMVGIVAPGISADAKKEKKKIIPAVKLDTSAEHIDVFEGIEQGLLEVKMIPKDSLGGNMLIENKGDKPLNVDFPAAFVGRQVLKQFGQQGGGGGFGGGFFNIPAEKIQPKVNALKNPEPQQLDNNAIQSLKKKRNK